MAHGPVRSRGAAPRTIQRRLPRRSTDTGPSVPDSDLPPLVDGLAAVDGFGSLCRLVVRSAGRDQFPPAASRAPRAALLEGCAPLRPAGGAAADAFAPGRLARTSSVRDRRAGTTAPSPS